MFKNEKFGPGLNPREMFRNHRERGPSVYRYTRRDIAEIRGVGLRAVPFGLNTINAVVGYLRRYSTRDSVVLSDEDFTDLPSRDIEYPFEVKVGQEEFLKLWSKRYPKFRICRCANYPKCKKVLLESRGYCRACGVDSPLEFSLKGGFRLRVAARWLSYESFIVGPRPKYTHIHHLDGNRWNNHASNLKVVTSEEYQELKGHPYANGWRFASSDNS